MGNRRPPRVLPSWRLRQLNRTAPRLTGEEPYRRGEGSYPESEGSYSASEASYRASEASYRASGGGLAEPPSASADEIDNDSYKHPADEVPGPAAADPVMAGNGRSSEVAMTHPGIGYRRTPAGAAPIPSFDNPADRPRVRSAPVTNGIARRRPRRRFVRSGLLVLGLLVLCLAWVGWRSFQAYGHLRTAAGLVSAMQAGVVDVTAINAADLDVTLGQLQNEAGQAHGAAEDPLVRAASHLPWVGSNFQALRAVSGTVDDLAANALPLLVTSAAQINPSTVKLTDGTIDLVPIERAAPALAQADAVIRAGIGAMTSVDRDGLLASVRAAVDNLQAKLVDTSKTTGTAASFSKLLPPLLGSQGQRRYLVVFQNNAEIRATGGIFGSYALVDVNEGRISLTSHGSAARTIKNFDQPVDTLGVDQLNLYGKSMALAPQNVNLTPDFPTAAALFAKMFQTRSGIAVDGVIAADPGALSYAMAGKAGIDVGGGVTLNSNNVVQFLLSDIYAKFPGQNQTQRDSFLSDATSLAFGSLLSGSGNNVVAVKGLVKAVDQRRLLVWSTHPDVQAALARTEISGSMASMGGSEAAPAFGVFLNDSTGTKLSYYLQNQVELSPGSCDAAGRRQWTATVTLSYPAPPKDLPTYVLADRKTDEYQLITKVMLVPLTSGTVTGAQIDGVAVSPQTGVDHFRPVAVVAVNLGPGTQAVVRFTITGGASGLPAGTEIAPQLYVTPGVSPATLTAEPGTAC